MLGWTLCIFTYQFFFGHLDMQHWRRRTLCKYVVHCSPWKASDSIILDYIDGITNEEWRYWNVWLCNQLRNVCIIEWNIRICKINVDRYWLGLLQSCPVFNVESNLTSVFYLYTNFYCSNFYCSYGYFKIFYQFLLSSTHR